MLGVDDAAAVAEAFELGVPVSFAGPAARGEQGQVWRLDTAAGSWAIKESYTRLDQAEVRRAGTLQRLARGSGVAAPKVRRTRAGGYVADIRGESIRAYGWVDVRPPDRRLDPAALGQAIARLHSTRVPPDGPTHPWYTEPVGDGWDDLLECSRAGGAPHAERLAAVRPELAELERLLAHPRPPVQLCHLDLWADNVRATADGGLCILDWDNAGSGDPVGELALVLFEFGDGVPDRIAAINRSYRTAGGPAQITGKSDFGMVVAQIGHIGERHLRRWLDPTLPATERPRTEAGIEEFLTGFLGLAAIATILDAVRT